MKILFVVKDIDFIDSIGIMLLSSLANKNGHEVQLGIINREDIIKKIEDIKPRLVAYSATTGEHKYYISLNKTIKSRFKDIFTIMGGAHATFYPECLNYYGVKVPGFKFFLRAFIYFPNNLFFDLLQQFALLISYASYHQVSLFRALRIALDAKAVLKRSKM